MATDPTPPPPSETAELEAFQKMSDMGDELIEARVREMFPTPSETKLSDAIDAFDMAIRNDWVDSDVSRSDVRAARSSLESLYREQMIRIEELERQVQSPLLSVKATEKSTARTEDAQPDSLLAYSCHYCGLGSVCHCDEEDDADDDRPLDCHRCSGDGWQECPDPIQCTYPHNKFGECPCHSCGGSGDAKDMTVW